MNKTWVCFSGLTAEYVAIMDQLKLTKFVSLYMIGDMFKAALLSFAATNTCSTVSYLNLTHHTTVRDMARYTHGYRT